MFGALGNGTDADSAIPVEVAGEHAFSQLIAGGFIGHTCALTGTGDAYCWGDNERGQVGDGTTIDRLAPEAVVGGLIFTSIDAGFRHTCGRDSTGALYCWGANGAGQLGNNTNTQSNVPAPVFQSPVLGLQLNQSVYGPGETMTVTAKLSPGSSPSPVDAYVVVQLPTGQFLSLQLGGGIVAGIAPIARGIVPIAIEAALVSYTFSGIEPPGAYTWYSVLTRPGTLEFVAPLQQVAFTLELTP